MSVTPQKKTIGNRITSYAVVLLVGIFLGISFDIAGHIRGQSENTSSSSLLGDSSSTTSQYSLGMSTQFAGPLVEIDSIHIATTSWVAIHDDERGVYTRVLGAQIFSPGMNTGTVSLLRYTIPGRTYHAVIHSDNGDRQFDYITDTPISDLVDGTSHILFSTYSADVPLRNDSVE